VRPATNPRLGSGQASQTATRREMLDRKTRHSFLEFRGGGPANRDQNMDLPARCPSKPEFRSWMIPLRERSSARGVTWPVHNNNRPRMTMVATNTLLSNQAVTVCAPTNMLVPLTSQRPIPIAKTYDNRVVWATRRASATPTAPVTRASSGYIIGFDYGVMLSKASTSPATKVTL